MTSRCVSRAPQTPSRANQLGPEEQASQSVLSGGLPLGGQLPWGPCPTCVTHQETGLFLKKKKKSQTHGPQALHHLASAHLLVFPVTVPAPVAFFPKHSKGFPTSWLLYFLFPVLLLQVAGSLHFFRFQMKVIPPKSPPDISYSAISPWVNTSSIAFMTTSFFTFSLPMLDCKL